MQHSQLELASRVGERLLVIIVTAIMDATFV